eukprot:TRINITY_DN4377_c0_g1_i2.p4 TRINITY_DN4377_c0_g1~~TRINITY_DN4377_c0_g1_i2.p4  ORF type:complete len:100 (-),score=47.90 TRINITY_DN4377_c0_g1_i2:114-413(-)
MEVGKKAVQGLKFLITGALKLIDTILSAFDFKISFGGKLSLEQVSVKLGVDIRIGSAHLKVSISITIKMASLKELAKLVFKHVKDYVLKKIPGIGKLIK